MCPPASLGRLRPDGEHTADEKYPTDTGPGECTERTCAVFVFTCRSDRHLFCPNFEEISEIFSEIFLTCFLEFRLFSQTSEMFVRSTCYCNWWVFTCAVVVEAI